jgi:hypothetical protein
MNKYQWVITIDDGTGSYRYTIGDNKGDHSVSEIKEMILLFLQGKLIKSEFIS